MSAPHHPGCVNNEDEHYSCLTGDGDYWKRIMPDQMGPLIELPCGHSYTPNHIQGDRKVTCQHLEHEDGNYPVFVVRGTAPSHVEYKVERFSA